MLKRPLSICLALAFGSLAAQATETIQLRSGNGSIGSTDSYITMLVGPANTHFGAAFTAADYQAAREGAHAPIINNHGAWIGSLPSDPAARWISTGFGGAGEGGTALFAMPFEVTTPVPGDATLTLYYAIDNFLGGGPNQGVHVNGMQVPGTTGGSFGAQYSLSADITGMLHNGINWLYILGSDYGGPGGSLFSATIEIEPGMTSDSEDLPGAFELRANHPNPFNPTTTLSFEMARTAPATLGVYAMDGRQVATLVDGLLQRGSHELVFDASGLASGVYVYTLSSEGFRESRKMLLLK